MNLKCLIKLFFPSHVPSVFEENVCRVVFLNGWQNCSIVQEYKIYTNALFTNVKYLGLKSIKWVQIGYALGKQAQV